MRKLSRRLVIITAIVGALIAFGYFQYASALQLHVSIKDSKLVERTQDGSLYHLQLGIKNPPLMVLYIGKTDFLITVDGEDLGTGILEPSLVPALGKTIAEAPFLADNQVLDKYDKSDVTPPVKLTGITRYNLVFTSLDIPFTYYPTQKEAREFIHGQ